MASGPVPHTSSQILTWFRDFLFKELGVRRELVTLDADLINHLGADSLDQLRIVMELEEQLEITIPDEEASEIRTVGDAVAIIQHQQQLKQSF